VIPRCYSGVRLRPYPQPETQNSLKLFTMSASVSLQDLHARETSQSNFVMVAPPSCPQERAPCPIFQLSRQPDRASRSAYVGRQIVKAVIKLHNLKTISFRRPPTTHANRWHCILRIYPKDPWCFAFLAYDPAYNLPMNRHEINKSEFLPLNDINASKQAY